MSIEFGAKHDCVNDKARKLLSSAKNVIKLPCYPFDARDLLGHLRERLAKHYAEPMSFDRLARFLGKSKSTAHFWFAIHRCQNLLGLMVLLERLSPGERMEFIEAHCRVHPTLKDPRLVYAHSDQATLLGLLNRRAGLTLVTGGSDAVRTFVFTALGNAYDGAARRGLKVAGIDLHCPSTFVPLLALKYIDGTLEQKRVSELVLKLWPKVLTSGALLLFNRVWSLVPETRRDLLRCAESRHVILAEEWSPDLARVAISSTVPVDVVKVSPLARNSNGIRVEYQQLKNSG